MSDQSADPVRPGSPADRKGVSPTATTAVLSIGAAGTASALWVIGCFKGHQLYWPDDALMLSWIALVGGALHKFWKWTKPLWQALGRKIYSAAGVPPAVAIILLLIAGCVSGCAGTAAKVDATLAKPATQADVRWMCLGLRGALGLAVAKYSNTPEFGMAQGYITSICAKADAGQLTNAQEAFTAVMDATGQLLAKLQAR